MHSLFVVGPSAGSDHTTLEWASEMAPYKFFVGVLLAVLVVWHWWHVRPCDTCGEFRQQCRCKPPEYARKRGA